jgi:hypothetical protein
MLGKTLVFISTVVLLNSCTAANPIFDFDFSNEKTSFSLDMKTSESVLNIQNSAKVVVSGFCEDKSKLKLTTPMSAEIQCKSGAFELSLDLAAIADGEIELAVESKNTFGELVVSQKKLIKDMTLPTLSLAQPANLSALEQTITLNGTCSENGEDVIVDEQSTGLKQKTICSSGAWSMVFDLGTNFSITTFYFKVNHKDKGQNNKQVDSSAMNRTVLGDFTITGVSHINLMAAYGAILKGNFNDFYVSWTPATDVQNFSISIYELNPTNGLYDIYNCGVTGIAGSASFKNMSSCVVIANTNYQVKMVGLNTLGQNIDRTFNFVTKALPRWRLDSRRLYLASSFGTATITNIVYSDFIDNYSAEDGPYTISSSAVDASLTAIQNIDDINQEIVVNPGATKISGKFSGFYKITDAYGNSSNFERIWFQFVMPFSWAGLIDNDFNKPSNWCGTIDLRNGCQGSVAGPSFGAKVMIDDLCSNATVNTVVGNCSPALSANAQIHTFYMKSNSFNQNGFSLTVGDVNDDLGGDFALSSTSFTQTGGQFNFSSSQGQLTVLNYFNQLGGVFYAPNNSNFIFNTKGTSGGIFAEITDKDNFHHNYGTIKFVDPIGKTGAGVKIAAPAEIEFNNLVIDSDGGYWKINTSNLIVNGNLTIGGRIRSGLYPQLLKENGTSKITLKGNLICSGQNSGGNLPIYLTGSQNSSYKITDADCTLPPIFISGSGAKLAEHGSSTQSLILQGLTVVSGGRFEAPASIRKMIFKTNLLESNSYSLNLTGGLFYHNNGTVEFHNTGNLAEIFIIKAPGSAFYNLSFVNNLGVNSFFSLEGNMTTEYLDFLGSSPIRLLGSSSYIQTNNLVFNKGLYNSVNKLSKIKISGVSATPMTVNTMDRINIANFELYRNIAFSGSSSYLDFSGASFELGTYQLTLPSGYELYYNTATSSGGMLNLVGSSTANVY